MSLNLFGKLASVAAIALGVSACVDVNIDVAVTSTTTARATMTQVMTADLYAMVKMGEESGESSEAGFCDEGTLTENADGTATCTMVEEGPFDSLDMGSGESGMSFTDIGNGLVRVALPTVAMKKELGADEEMDEETKQMVLAFFEGHSITLTISGAEVTDTNMTRAADGKSASQVIPMLDLINGTVDLPDELFAVVRAP
ncbi:hypothetical protein [Devosia sp. 63-57]|uniref:hypothetical protein n=1 Tax=Devosia sp. 63-57 TaxID=1895751 RepID=UPI000868615F|nr:hypothetical protein [Devosia sp. 63-57]ODT48266.1 MAG: hypothetical protein ABS74_19100 [Pelagibacterium sp. SCN 63-126]ODU85843.1 MAG: hypothetical protein ABT14_11380 [Pelagibacterium sp. SCN 63-17]OJX42021.1 MAG: hypothetical protein BGO80_10745 [Devosia sp. 63-57]